MIRHAQIANQIAEFQTGLDRLTKFFITCVKTFKAVESFVILDGLRSKLIGNRIAGFFEV